MGKPFIWVALDGLWDDEERTLSLARELDTTVAGGFGFKVNADWIFLKGFQSSPMRVLPDRPIFIDLKLWLGARTMTWIVCMASDAGATATNIHVLAGATNPTAAHPGHAGELTRTLANFRRLRPRSKMRTYGVSILTHYGEAYVHREFGRGLAGEVLHLAEQARSARTDGIIMPGNLLASIDSAGFDNLLKVFPGTRWEDFTDSRHESEVHPASVRGRDDVELVCGSPIWKAQDPVSALRKLLALVE